MANIEDGATGTVLTAPSPQSSGTTLNLNSGETLRFPTPPFWAIAHPNSQIPVKSIAEKILVTAMNTGTDQITFVRAQGGYTAKNIDVGWRISNAIFKDDFNNASIVNNEVPTGSINGSNTAFTLASSVHTNGSLMVHKNGVRMKGGGDDFTETTTGFTMTTAPATGTVLLVDYVITGAINNVGTNSLITDETPTGSVNGSNTAFTAARAYIPGSLEVHINGVKQKRVTHFTETTPASGIFTMGDAPLTGDDIMINYAFNLNPSGNTDTVDGYHANATPTANTIPVLDASARTLWASMPVGTIRQLGYVSRSDVSTATSGSTANTWYNVKNTANTADFAITATTTESTIYVEFDIAIWYASNAYKYVRATIDGTITNIAPDAMAAAYLTDQVTTAGATFSFTSVSPGSHTFGLQVVNQATGATQYRAATMRVYEVKS